MRRKTLLAVSLLVAFSMLATSLNAAKLSEATLKKKKEGWYPTGLPLINYTTDTGLGYGLRLYLYYNGSREDQYFDTAPYFFQMYIQYFATTLGRYYHEVNVDMPYFMKTKFRIRAAFAYDKNLNANYFGLGSEAADQKLTNPVTGEEYDTYEDYEEEFLKSDNKQNY